MKKLIVSIVFCMFCAIASAQEFRGTISGRVVDPQEAVVPGVGIEVMEVSTRSTRRTVTDAEGIYTVPFLSPGLYEVVAEAHGFKRYVRQGVQVSTNERVGLDIHLEVGQAAQSVVVTGEVPMLGTATASAGQVIGTHQIENMPLNGRTPLTLAQLSFGVIPSSDPRFYRPFDNAGPSGFSIGGGNSQNNELLLDGLPDTTANLRVAYNPPVDAVDEVKVELFQADASYGHSAGGTVHLVTRSGTNALHGSIYWFNQITNTSANQFFNNQQGKPKPTLRYNQWGFTVGGPVFIPKLFDGRDRLFFFFAYEGVRDALPKPDFATVPTAAERAGDFSALLKLGSNYQVYDPKTAVVVAGQIQRSPFPGNIILPDRFSPITQHYLALFPPPNSSGKADGSNNFLSPNQGERNSFHNEFTRMDYNISQRHKVFFNFRHNIRYSYAINNLGYQAGQPGGDNGGPSRTNNGFSFDDVVTLSPSTVLNTRGGWTRFTEGGLNFTRGFDLASFGFPASLNSQAQERIMPRVTFDDFGGNGSRGIGNGGDSKTPQDVFQIFSSLVRIQGSHSLKAGVDFRLYRESSANLSNVSGTYKFSNNSSNTGWTRGPFNNSPKAPLGQDLAAFLLGMPTSGSWDVSATRTNQAGYYAVFFQDDYRPRSNLTLNLGLRYDRDLPTTERYNRSVNGFDTSTPSPIEAAARAAYARNPIAEIPASQFHVLGGPLFAAPGNRSIYRTQNHYFSPRLGFAWSPKALGDKTVIRGGTGVFFAGIGTAGINQTGFSQSTDFVASLDGFATPAATLANPFPTGIRQPPGSLNGLASDIGKTITFSNPNRLNPYSIRWDLTLQRQLQRDMVLEVGYVGNHSVHLPVDAQINYVPRQYLSTSPVRDQAVINNLTANVPNPFAGLVPGVDLNGPTVARQQLLMIYPQFTGLTPGTTTGVTMQAKSDGSSYFHMFAARLDKRFAHGFQFLSNFSYSKLMERRSRLNPFDPLELRVAADDRPLRFVTSFNYDLPFGGKKLHGGWSVNAIYTWQIGAPLDWSKINPIYYGGPLNLDPRNVDHSFDTTRFNTISNQQLAMNVRTFPSQFSSLRQDGANNVDFSVLKNTFVREKLKVQFRSEFFNLLNHPTFNAPNLTPASKDFGTITTQSNLSRRIQFGLRMVW